MNQPLTWCDLASPIGDLVLVAGAEGLAEVVFVDARERHGIERSMGTPTPTDETLAAARAQLDEYFRGERAAFDLPLDLSARQGFAGAAQAVLSSVPFGSTISYTELATQAGRPRAVRAAASACASNPLPIVVPCHRVVRSDGSLGGYLGGLAAKRWLIDHERTHAGSQVAQ